jgi:hypothetical protein
MGLSHTLHNVAGNFRHIPFVLLLVDGMLGQNAWCNANRFLEYPSYERNKENRMSTLNAKIDSLMDAKYNRLLDSGVLRMALVAVGFTAWLVGGFALLKFV